MAIARGVKSWVADLQGMVQCRGGYAFSEKNWFFEKLRRDRGREKEERGRVKIK